MSRPEDRMQAKSIDRTQASFLCLSMRHIMEILGLQTCSINQVQAIILIVFEVESTLGQFDIALVVQMVLDLQY